MPVLTDRVRIRARLERDRMWSAYALGDLSPAFAAHAEWRSSPRDEALVLVYRAVSPPIVFAIGPPDALQPVLQEIEAPELSLQLQPAMVAALAPRFEVVALREMWRMCLRPSAFSAPDLSDVEVLGPGDVDALRRLYRDGEPAGEAPHFFDASMLDAGFFRGVRRDDGELVAAAGTHLVAADLGVCAIGNVYTHRAHRGRGLGTRVTAAVAGEALVRRMSTVVLNVRQSNEGARRLYERLGFTVACAFVEGEARRADRARS